MCLASWLCALRAGGVLLFGGLSPALAQEARVAPALASLSLAEVTQEALTHRAEISAARARAAAAGQRPAIVAALDDPMVSPAIDHYPFEMMEGSNGRYDWSVSVEQSFPLSGVRGYRRRASEADASRVTALADQVVLDVAFDAQRSFFMLRERRLMRAALEQQAPLSRGLVAAANARYSGGSGAQADVLRAEVEVARLEAARRVLDAQTRSAEAMLNASMGRDVLTPVGELIDPGMVRQPLPSLADALQSALDQRPELRAGRSEVDRATAEIEVMRSMYRPMATVRIGRASTMAEGDGAMLMLGFTVPIWREKLQAGVSEARAMESMANADLGAMRRMIEGETAAAFGEAEASRESQAVLESDVIPRARAAVDAALAAYAAGQLSLFSVVEASRALWDLRSEQVMADTAANLARLRFERAIGASPGKGRP